MAKKSSKPSRTKAKAVKKTPVKKPAAKSSLKAPGKSAPAAFAGFAISTGKGATPHELGKALVEHFNKGTGDEWIQKVWSKDITSIEGFGANRAWKGAKAVIAKGEAWMAENTILGASAEGPFVGSTGFAIKFAMHVKNASSGHEMHMTEVGVYTVKAGKIITEEFMYFA